jgi:hypothetical protein
MERSEIFDFTPLFVAVLARLRDGFSVTGGTAAPQDRDSASRGAPKMRVLPKRRHSARARVRRAPLSISVNRVPERPRRAI